MKKFYFASILMAGMALPLVTNAADSGTCGQNCSWKIENNVLTVSPTVSGEPVVMDNYSNVSTGETDSAYSYRTAAPWGDAYQTITKVVVSDGIDTVGERAFQGLRNVTSVSLPDGLTTLGRLSFDRMTSLTSVDIPSSVQTIGRSAFNFCSFSSVDIPDSVTSIGDYAFGHNANLESINLPDGLTSLGYAFLSRSNNVSSIILPESLFEEGAEGINPIMLGYTQNVTVYCAQGNQNCLNYQVPICPDGVTDANENLCVYAADAPSLAYGTYTKEPNGSYVIDGVRYASFADMARGRDGAGLKRIYTVKEANDAAGKKNTFKIRYK